MYIYKSRKVNKIVFSPTNSLLPLEIVANDKRQHGQSKGVEVIKVGQTIPFDCGPVIQVGLSAVTSQYQLLNAYR